MRALALFVTALWAAIVAPALADGSRLDAILERHVLRVGTTGDSPVHRARQGNRRIFRLRH